MKSGKPIGKTNMPDPQKFMRGVVDQYNSSQGFMKSSFANFKEDFSIEFVNDLNVALINKVPVYFDESFIMDSPVCLFNRKGRVETDAMKTGDEFVVCRSNISWDSIIDEDDIVMLKDISSRDTFSSNLINLAVDRVSSEMITYFQEPYNRGNICWFMPIYPVVSIDFETKGKMMSFKSSFDVINKNYNEGK